jgi:hypothetical protein
MHCKQRKCYISIKQSHIRKSLKLVLGLRAFRLLLLLLFRFPVVPGYAIRHQRLVCDLRPCLCRAVRGKSMSFCRYSEAGRFSKLPGSARGSWLTASATPPDELLVPATPPDGLTVPIAIRYPVRALSYCTFSSHQC